MPSFDNLGTRILEMIRDWLIELVEIFINFLQNVMFSYDGLGGIALQAYDIFVWFGGLLLVSVALGKVINQLIGEAEGSQEANILAYSSGFCSKQACCFVIMPFVVSIVMNGIIEPFTDYFVGLMGDEMIASVETLVESEKLC
ncbi:MAG: hypothetical protein LRY71_18280 [Bacillaceae bacterium]|nr:hypothetical protein [Bacillaceae bacterium]